MTLARPTILVAEPFDPAALATLEEAGRVRALHACDETSLKSAVSDCDALLVRTAARVTRAVIESAPRLRVIGRGGVGLDNIDLDAARERHIAVVYTPAASTDAVADLAVGLMINLLRKVSWTDQEARQGRFSLARDAAVSREMSELTVGIVGLGRIGRAVARRCRHGFRMRVVYNDIVEPGWLDFTAEPMSKPDLFRTADIITLHTPLTSETRNLIHADTLALFKDSAILINTARGPIVNSLDLARALSNGKLTGAGLDVTDPEPLPPDHPLRRAPNTLVTPHLGARTVGSLARMNAVVEDVVRVLRGQPPLYSAC
jgi:D-3-phosphoglycerate dehydrogenase